MPIVHGILRAGRVWAASPSTCVWTFVRLRPCVDCRACAFFFFFNPYVDCRAPQAVCGLLSLCLFLLLQLVTYQPMSVIITTFKKQDVKRPLEGFGVLVPSKEQKNGFQTLGTLFSSMMFPDRAPTDQYLFTTFIGGSRNRSLAKKSLKELKEVTMNDLNKILHVEGQPLSVKHVYWSEAFPQYSLDYNSVLEAIDKIEESLPGFYYAGNQRGGLSVGKALLSGYKAADLLISHFKSLEERKLCSTDCMDQEAK